MSRPEEKMAAPRTHAPLSAAALGGSNTSDPRLGGTAYDGGPQIDARRRAREEQG